MPPLATDPPPVHPEPCFSRRGDELYRSHLAHGVFVLERWAAGAWHVVPDIDYVMYKTVAVSAHTAAEMIERAREPVPET